MSKYKQQLSQEEYENTLLKGYKECKTLDEKFDFIAYNNRIAHAGVYRYVFSSLAMISIENAKYHTPDRLWHTVFIKTFDWNYIDGGFIDYCLDRYLYKDKGYSFKINKPEDRSVDIPHLHIYEDGK